MAGNEEDDCPPSKHSYTTSGVFIEPPPFTSIDEAHQFLRNHEIATNNKFITEMSRKFTTAGVDKMKYPKLRWTFPLSEGDYFDGVPFGIIGIKKFSCQYGANYKESRQRAEAKQRQIKGWSGRTRAVAPSKKVNCPAKAKMTIIVKFPDYAIVENTRVKRYVMGSKLKREFSDDTQRYALVYLRIFYHHEHGAFSLQLNNIPSKITPAHVQSTSAIVLKPGASLRGRSLNGVISQFASCSELPDSLAQPNVIQTLETMKVEELLALFWDLTGETPNKIFLDTQKEFTLDGLQLLLHMCIVFANAESEADGRIVAHRSIRIAGTENDFKPILCCETNCVLEDPHMHCPLCTWLTAYTDPNVLKTHYKKKHVDLSIDCAGLKILRCRDECVVKGFIKDIKAYTRGHWHCWKCDMGYEKRFDQTTLKHFQSHLDNYQSGSVLVTKSVYPSTNSGTVTFNMNPTKMKVFSTTEVGSTHKRNESSSENEDHEVLTRTSSSAIRPLVDTDLIYTHAAGEEVAGEDEQAVLYIQEGDEEIVYAQSNGNTDEVIITEHDDRIYLREKVAELEQRCMLLEHKNLSQKSHIAVLNQKIQSIESKQHTLCSKCSEAITQDKSDLTMPVKKEQNVMPVRKKNTREALLKVLEELRTKHRTRNDSKSDQVCELTEDLTEGVMDIKKEIERFKIVAGIGKEFRKSGTPSNGQTTAAQGETKQALCLADTDASECEYVATPLPQQSCVGVNETTDEVDDHKANDTDSDTDNTSEVDYTMFGKSGRVKKGRKSIVIPLPDNAVEIVKKCGEVNSNQVAQSQETIYVKREKSPVTRICRYWQGEDNDRLTQTDFDEEFEVNYNENIRLPSIVVKKKADKSKVSEVDNVSNNNHKSCSLNQATEHVPVSSVTTMDKHVSAMDQRVSTIVEHDTTIVEDVIVDSKLNSCTSDSGNIIPLKSDSDERLNSNTTHTVDAITSNQSVDKMGSHGSSSMVSVTSKPSVKKIMNSNSNKAILVKAVKLKPSVEEKLNSVGSVLVNSVTSKSTVNNGARSVKYVKLKPSVEKKLNSIGSVSVVSCTTLEPSVDKTSKSDGTSPVKAVTVKPSAQGEANTIGAISMKCVTSESSVDRNMKSDGTSPMSAVVEKSVAAKRSTAGKKSLTSKPSVDKSSIAVMQTRGVSRKRHTETKTKHIDVGVTVAKKKRFN